MSILILIIWAVCMFTTRDLVAMDTKLIFTALMLIAFSIMELTSLVIRFIKALNNFMNKDE